MGFFTKTDFFHTKPNKIPHNCGKLCGKNQRATIRRGRPEGRPCALRTQVGALLGAPSRHSASFVSRCISKSYVNITKVMRNRISTTEIRFRGNCGAARRKKGKPLRLAFFLFFRNALILREVRAYLQDRTDTLPDSKRRRRHRCSTCCRPC